MTDNRTKLGRVVEAVRKRRLMEAAAPDLYEALLLARMAARGFNVRLSPNELAQVDAALAKARGEQVSA